MIIGIFVILIVASYFLYEKFFKKEINLSQKPVENDESFETSYDSLFSLSSLVRLEEFHMKDELDFDTLSTQAKYEMALKRINPSTIRIECGNEDCSKITFFISLENMEKGFKSAFGSSAIIPEITEIEINLASSLKLLDMKLDSNVSEKITSKDYFVSKESFMMNYDKDSKAYMGTFIIKRDNQYQPKYSYASNLRTYKKGDKIILVEKIIFIDPETNEIYADYRNTIKIGEASSSNISVSDYMSVATTITYTFGTDEVGNYYFISSKIER